MRSEIKKIPYVILAIALILISQLANPFIGQFWTDTITCFLLITSIMIFDIVPSIIIAVAIPFLAKILAITNLPIAILSVMAVVNLLFVTIYTISFQVFASNSIYQKVFTWGISVLVSALIKFLVFYFIVNKLLLSILEINEAIVYQFDFTHFYTTLLAGFLSFFMIKPIKRITTK